MSKDQGKASSSTNKQTKKTKNDARFHLVADFKYGQPVPKAPPQYGNDFRVLRQMVRWAKRYGLLREGRLRIYVSKNDMERNHVWRTIELARSVVSYRASDRKIIINTSDPSPEILKIKVEQGKFKQWVNQLLIHRQFGQAKLAPVPKPTPVPSQPAPTLEAKKEAVSTVAILDDILAKMEENLKENPATLGDPQREYLAMAKEAQSKFHGLLGLDGETERSKKLQPPKSKKPVAQPVVPSPPPKQETPKVYTMTKVQATPTKSQMKTPAETKAPSPAPPSPVKQPTPSKIEIGLPETPKTPVGTASPVQSSVESDVLTPLSTEADDVSADEQRDNSPETDDDRSSAEETPTPTSGTPIPTYRQKLPVAMGPAPSLFRIAMSAIGRDVTNFSLPAAAMEPLNILQVLCEELEYSELIDKALATEEAHTRMVYVACFAASRYGSTAFRSGRKPFNPLLGQTFEFQCHHLGWKFVGEQVQYHPSVSACYAEGRDWRWWQDFETKVSYGGSSMEVTPLGVVYLNLPRWKETYKWNKVSSCVSGLLSGSLVLDHYGDLTVLCDESKMTATLHFKKQTSDRRGDVEGKVVNSSGEITERIYGNWSDSLYVGDSVSESHCIWRLAALPPEYSKYYGMSRFALTLNEYRTEIHGVLPKTDSRFRPDQKALEMGKASEADKIKKDLEERQRKRRKEAEAERRPAHRPLWFGLTGNTDPKKGSRWVFNGAYWKAKESGFRNVASLALW